jgi:hypothetical protein
MDRQSNHVSPGGNVVKTNTLQVPKYMEAIRQELYHESKNVASRSANSFSQRE